MIYQLIFEAITLVMYLIDITLSFDVYVSMFLFPLYNYGLGLGHFVGDNRETALNFVSWFAYDALFARIIRFIDNGI